MRFFLLTILFSSFFYYHYTTFLFYSVTFLWPKLYSFVTFFHVVGKNSPTHTYTRLGDKKKETYIYTHTHTYVYTSNNAKYLCVTLSYKKTQFTFFSLYFFCLTFMTNFLTIIMFIVLFSLDFFNSLKKTLRIFCRLYECNLFSSSQKFVCCKQCC